MPRSPARWKATSRKPGGRVGTERSRTASCCSNPKIPNSNSRSPRALDLNGATSRRSCARFAGSMGAGADTTPTRKMRSSRRPERSCSKTTTAHSPGTAPPTTIACAPRSRGWRNRSSRAATRTTRPFFPRPFATRAWRRRASASNGRGQGGTSARMCRTRCCRWCKSWRTPTRKRVFPPTS